MNHEVDKTNSTHAEWFIVAGRGLRTRLQYCNLLCSYETRVPSAFSVPLLETGLLNYFALLCLKNLFRFHFLLD